MSDNEGKSMWRHILREKIPFISSLTNMLRFRIRFRKSVIRKPLEILFSNLNNLQISDNVVINARAIIRIIDDCHLFIGEDTIIGPYCHISGTENNIVIGKKVGIADRVFISTTNHRYDDITKPIKSQGFVSRGDVVIDDECWIGIGSSILSGVNIGKHSVIGANSVVTHDIPPYSVAVGNPARVIKRYNSEKKRWLSV